jgi:hypothetical protein
MKGGGGKESYWIRDMLDVVNVPAIQLARMISISLLINNDRSMMNMDGGHIDTHDIPPPFMR